MVAALLGGGGVAYASTAVAMAISGNRCRSPQEQLKLRKRDGPMSWLDEMEAADPAYPGDVSYPAAGTRAGRGLYQLYAVLDDGHLDAGRDLIADWYARQANHSGHDKLAS